MTLTISLGTEEHQKIEWMSEWVNEWAWVCVCVKEREGENERAFSIW